LHIAHFYLPTRMWTLLSGATRVDLQTCECATHQHAFADSNEAIVAF
jgi:hypothetical protein